MGSRDEVEMTTSEKLDHTLKAYGRLEIRNGAVRRERDRYREALEDAAEYLRLASTWIDDTDRHLKMRRACERAREALDARAGGASAPAPPTADQCTSADCERPATKVVSVEDTGYHPYCDGCAEVLLRGGEHLHPSMAASSESPRKAQSDG